LSKIEAETGRFAPFSRFSFLTIGAAAIDLNE